MTLANGIGLAIGGGFFIATILTRDWLEGTYTTTMNGKLSADIMGRGLPSLKDMNSTIRVIRKLEYSLRHLCVKIKFDFSGLSRRLYHLKRNITEFYKGEEREICYAYGHIGQQLPAYATGDIKRFKHVFVYILCTVGLAAVGFILSLIDIILLRSIKKSIIKFTSIGFSLIAAISGMVGILLARIERTSDSLHRYAQQWNYGYSFVLACVGESVLVFMVIYNILEHYLRTRKRVAEDCEYLRPESYPLNAQ